MTPTEYIYIKNPLFSDGEDMIKTTLQELCLKDILSIDARMVLVDKKYSKKRLRYYLQLNSDSNKVATSSHAEKFLLQAFKKNTELSFANIRNYLKFHFKKDLNKFKYRYVLKDLRADGYCWFRHFPTGKARKEKNAIKKKLAYVNKNIDFLTSDPAKLEKSINSLGLNIILLEKSALKKIKEANKKVAAINSLNFEAITNSLNGLDAFVAIGAFDSIDSFDFGGASVGFDGFGGGGDFDGGGSGIDW